jgi:integrase
VPAGEEILGAFLEGPYRRWAKAHLKSSRETLAALKADFGDCHEAGRKQGAGWWLRPMSSITAMDADEWQTTELVRGNKPTTINRAWQRLHAALAKALEWNVIPGPLPRLKKLRVDKRGRVRFLSAEERARLFAALDERERQRWEKRARHNEWRARRHRSTLPELGGVFTDYLQPLTRTWLGSGLRKSEALRLCWRNIDFECDLINVPGEISKNSQSRAVPMVPELKASLLIWRSQHPGAAPEQLMFCTRRGRLIRHVYRSWKALMQSARITDFRIHDCRHDYASRLAMAGVSLKTIAVLLGHEDLTMVQRYAHLSQSHLHDSLLKLAPDPMPSAACTPATDDRATDVPFADRAANGWPSTSRWHDRATNVSKSCGSEL